MYNQKQHEGEAVTERRGVNRDELSDHERILLLESQMDRFFDFVGVFKDAIGHLWAWLDRNVRGGGGKRGG